MLLFDFFFLSEKYLISILFYFFEKFTEMETFVDSDFSTIFLNLHKVRPISTSSRNVCQNILFPFLSQAAKQPKANTWRNSGTVKARYGPTRDVFLFFSTHRAKSKTPCQKTPDTDVRYQFYVSSDSVKFLQFLILTRFIKPRLAQNCVAFFLRKFATCGSWLHHVHETCAWPHQNQCQVSEKGAIFHHQSAPIKERC